MGTLAADSKAELDVCNGVLSFSVKVSPLKKARAQGAESLMKRADRDVCQDAQKAVKQARPSEQGSEQTAEQPMEERKISAREIAAAKAARARLYGDASGGQVTVVVLIILENAIGSHTSIVTMQ